MYLEVTITKLQSVAFIYGLSTRTVPYTVFFCYKFKIYDSPAVWLLLFHRSVSVLISNF